MSAAVRTPVSQEWVERYLAFLGVPREAPSFASLSRLTQAHLHAVVFENITSLLRRRIHGSPVPALDPEAVLTGWEANREEWVQDRCIDETWTPFFTYNLRPGDEQVRQAAYQRHHVPGESFVVSSLTLVRCEEHQVLQLRNNDFVRHTDDGKQKAQVTDPEAYTRIVAEEFRLPQMPIVDAVAPRQELARDLPEPWTLRLST